jgi:VWFA-related protein
LVQNLKPEDITVTDGGTPVKISSLRLVSDDKREHFITLVFDRMDSSAAHNSRDVAVKILKIIPTDGFSLCVMRVAGRLMLYRDFTSDRVALKEGITQATDDDKQAALAGESVERRLISIAQTGSADSRRVSPEERTHAQVILASLQESQQISAELHTHPGLSGLLALAKTERRLPGRKTVIFFSQGLQSDATSEERLHDIVGAANRAGVSIYVVDANALTERADQSLVAMIAIGNQRSAMAQTGPAAVTTGSGTQTQTVAQAPAGLVPMVSNQLARYESADPSANRSPFVGLADDTGGAYVPAGGDPKKPLRRMIEDMTVYYEASYASPIQNYDGQFRPIVVKPVRGELKIRSRAGYFALPPDVGQTVRPFEAPLLKLFAETSLPSDIAFHAKVFRLGKMPDGHANTLVVEVPMSELETHNDPNSNLYSAHISIVAQVKNEAGAIIDHFGEDIPWHGSLSAENIGPQFITMQRHFTAEPGNYILETAILDRNGGKAGAQRSEFQILGSDDGPSISDLAMVQRIDPVPEEVDPGEPMRYGKGKVVPTVGGRVQQGTKELSFFFVVHSDANISGKATLEMEVLKSGEPVAQVPLTLRETNGPAAMPYLASIQSARLPRGDYQIVERLTQGGKTTERELSFRIDGGASEVVDAPYERSTSNSNADSNSVSGMQLPESDGHSGRGVVITSLPADTVPPPTQEQRDVLIESARKRALAYSKALPNFICVEVTNRSVDPAGKGNWKHRDSIAELLTYHDNAESRTTLEVDGRRSSLKRTDLNSTWPLSVREFGAMLNLVFQPTSKTSFEWKEAASLGDGGGYVQVLSYRVVRENATIVLGQGNDQAAVGFHGLIYIDPTTGGVRRVTLQADGIPHSFAIRGAAMTVDYDFVAISGRDYLLPVRSSVTLERAHHKIELNEIAFRNYRRFASRAKIKILQ